VLSTVPDERCAEKATLHNWSSVSYCDGDTIIECEGSYRVGEKACECEEDGAQDRCTEP
jgi:hypothetical protein